MGKLNVDGTEIQVLQIEEDDYISLTDMVRKIDNGSALIEKWLRNKNTIEFLGIWEEIYNEDFDTNAYDEIMQEAELTAQQTTVIYASEADVLNMALFGMTAKQWCDNNPDRKGNIRDYASVTELICLSNMENINAVLIEDGLSQKERLIKLNKIAIHQMSILETQTTTVLK